jgi:hypothetical protein
MKLKTLTIFFFLFYLNLTENSVIAGGPSDQPSPPSPSPPNKDKLCANECFRNGQRLTSSNGKFSLVIMTVSEGGAIYVNNNETGLLTKLIYVSDPCSVEICIDSGLKLKVTACGRIIYQLQLSEGDCLQITDDGRVIIVDKNGKEVMEIWQIPIPIKL